MWKKLMAKELVEGDWLNWSIGGRLLGPIQKIEREDDGRLCLTGQDGNAWKRRFPDDSIQMYVDPQTGESPKLRQHCERPAAIDC